MTTKYYIEFVNIVTGDYNFQTGWFDSIKDAKSWLLNFEYIDIRHFNIALLKAKFDKDGEYHDIKLVEKNIDLDHLTTTHKNFGCLGLNRERPVFCKGGEK